MDYREDRVIAVLLPDGIWHSVEYDQGTSLPTRASTTFRIGGGRFRFSPTVGRESEVILGPASSVMAVKVLPEPGND